MNKRKIVLRIYSFLCKIRWHLQGGVIRIGARTKIYNPSKVILSGDIRIFHDCVLNPHGVGYIEINDVVKFMNIQI